MEGVYLPPFLFGDLMLTEEQQHVVDEVLSNIKQKLESFKGEEN